MAADSKIEDWSNRRGVIIGGLFGLIFVGITVCSNQPKYHPSAVFQPKNGDDAQRIAELTTEARTCDEAIRSLLLAVSNEIVNDPTIAPRQQVRSLVESNFALVPPACQEVINPKSASSDGDLTMTVESAKAYRGDVTVNLRVFNTGTLPVFLGFSDYRGAGVHISDNNSSYYTRYNVEGVFDCISQCTDLDIGKFTKIDPGASASLIVEGSNASSSSAQEASLAMTLFEAQDE